MFRISQLTLLSWDNMVFRVTDYDLVFFFHAHPFVDGFYVHWNFELQILLLNIWDVSIEHKFLHISVVWKTWTCDTQIQKKCISIGIKIFVLFLQSISKSTRSVYYDPFLAAAAAQADPNYRLQVCCVWFYLYIFYIRKFNINIEFEAKLKT